jgi:ATP synthase subunit 6
MIFYFDIIEQFDINVLISLIKENPFYVIENLVVEFIMFLVLYFFITKKKYGFYNIFFTGFSRIITKNLGEKFTDNYLFYSVNMIFFYLLFLYIVIQNLLGLIPETLTITALLLLPAQVAFTFFIAAFILAIYNCGFQLPKAFVPFGIPSLIAPFLSVIEFISYFIRLFSLSIRLFINLLAGHLLFKIFSTNLYDLLEFLYNSLPSEILGMIVIYFYFFLEIAAAILQAIVLTSLVAIYLNESAGLLKNF